ncbi:hypothetical protein [Actinoallomurus sp. NPDC052274]|uniref:hypothetical protein n=1 Tax=Actinoallomurus sp. NPDC052274 TaxID=3155420 RepID=UPI00343F0141
MPSGNPGLDGLRERQREAAKDAFADLKPVPGIRMISEDRDPWVALEDALTAAWSVRDEELERLHAEREELVARLEAYQAMRDESATRAARLLSLKVTIRDKRAAEGITPDHMSRYLTKHQWTRKRCWDNSGELWYHPAKDVDVFVPLQEEFVDYAERVADFLSALAEVEDRSALAVMLDLTGDGEK